MEKNNMECPNGCGNTLEEVSMDKLYTGPDGQQVIAKDMVYHECSECGDHFTPAKTMKQISAYFRGEYEPDGIAEVPTLHKKSA